ncbi:hypothetical protein RUM43_006141 [Polyplax serrata]|uniref:Uncharacterized protein n=1 Tax=Polyplax serrata TaxID=468196 RepID=A0AAN8S596_POLSC
MQPTCSRIREKLSFEDYQEEPEKEFKGLHFKKSADYIQHPACVCIRNGFWRRDWKKRKPGEEPHTVMSSGVSPGCLLDDRGSFGRKRQEEAEVELRVQSIGFPDSSFLERTRGIVTGHTDFRLI